MIFKTTRLLLTQITHLTCSDRQGFKKQITQIKGALGMRDLLFKNLTSSDRKKRIIASSEIIDKQGIRSIIRRHFVCILKEVKDNNIHRPLPYLYVIKERNTRKQKEKFFCRIKGSVYAISNGRLFLILFMHSLKINLVTITQNLKEYSEES